MAETENIARMAEILSQEMFGEFLWQRSGPMNQNWRCESIDLHKVNTHPTDVVFFYDEPYAARRTYLQTDLKSYAKGSITSHSIRSALKSLGKQVACAEVSTKWRELYAHSNVNFDISGLLFVYNHDGEYDADFRKILSEIKNIELDLPRRSKIYVIGPDDIFWLDNVRNEIQRMRGLTGSRRLPGRQHCSYVYPQLVRKINVRGDTSLAATMEMLSSPLILLRYKEPGRHMHDNYVVFCRRGATSPDEYMYLFDYLRHHELLQYADTITVRVMAAEAATAALMFAKAKTQYLEEVLEETANTPMANIINSIVLEPLPQTVTSFSTIVLGME